MTPESFLKGRVSLWQGDCRDVLARLDADSIDSCVTDPPYHLASIVKQFGADNAAPAKSNGASGVYKRASSGFMGQRWDGGDIAFEPATWAAVYRVLKPGAHLLAFGAPKNFGFMQVAIAEAGFEIRDMVAWIFGTGFPKSHNLDGEWDGWGTALKPAIEPIVLARKPLSEKTVAANVLRWRTGALNVDGCRIEAEVARPRLDRRKDAALDATGNTYGTGLHGSMANGTTELGRWPANVLHDGSDEVAAMFPAQAGSFVTSRKTTKQHDPSSYGLVGSVGEQVGYGDAGSAARFFYSAKADADDRIGSRHPTVKPVDLMQWLVRLVTPPNGTVLDPFAGTGTTGEAAWREGMSAVLIEREDQYCSDIRRRMEMALAGPEERARAIVKAKGADEDPGPLFAHQPYNASDDVTKSFEAAYEAIRQRKAAGGPGWEPA